MTTPLLIMVFSVYFRHSIKMWYSEQKFIIILNVLVNQNTFRNKDLASTSVIFLIFWNASLFINLSEKLWELKKNVKEELRKSQNHVKGCYNSFVDCIFINLTNCSWGIFALLSNFENSLEKFSVIYNYDINALVMYKNICIL